MDIQWYPGHMAKTKRQLAEDISRVDVVIELLDARIPSGSRNPDIDSLSSGKRRIIVLNKSDLADRNITVRWKEYFERAAAANPDTVGFRVITAEQSAGGRNLETVKAARELMVDKIERLRAKGRISVPIRAMVAGVPNVGKSTFINNLVGRKITQTGDRPGVTRSRQWVRIYKDIELLDTPGILWPKFDDKETARDLAFTGAIKDENLDMQTLACELIEVLNSVAPDAVKTRYKIDYNYAGNSYDILIMIARARGFIKKGGEPDAERAAIILLDEFRAAKLGRVSIESPPLNITE